MPHTSMTTRLNGISTKSNVVLCPSTEGNLGDGIFRMKRVCREGGRWSVGTDSHIGLNPGGLG